jgi:hypothetical protein
MPLLQVRDIPADVYEELARVARVENRSIAQQTVTMLRSALQLTQERTARRKATLEEISKLTDLPFGNLPDAAELIREDRNR